MTPPAAEAAVVRPPVPALPSRRRTQVRHPRRVSGPARPSARAASAAGPAVALPRAPVVRRRRREGQGLALRTVDALSTVSRSALLDRLIRSRAWIGLIAVSLIGLVAMQLLALHLNTQVGRVLAREAGLQRQNTQLSIAASEDTSGSVVEPAGAAAGMTVAPSGSLRFATASPSTIPAAVAALQAPLQPALGSSEPSSAPTPTPAGEATSSAVPTGEVQAGSSTNATSSSPAVVSSTGGAAETGASSAPTGGG
jgi:hypothetical protein